MRFRWSRKSKEFGDLRSWQDWSDFQDMKDFGNLTNLVDLEDFKDLWSLGDFGEFGDFKGLGASVYWGDLRDMWVMGDLRDLGLDGWDIREVQDILSFSALGQSNSQWQPYLPKMPVHLKPPSYSSCGRLWFLVGDFCPCPFYHFFMICFIILGENMYLAVIQDIFLLNSIRMRLREAISFRKIIR